MINLENILKETKNVDDFRIVTRRSESYELFYVHRKLETVRATDATETDVTVYVKHDGFLGDSAFTLYSGATEGDAKKKIAAAAERAKLVCNKPYELPSGGFKIAELPTNITEYSLQELASLIAEAVFAADCYEEGSINATEIFLYADTTVIVNSRGTRKTQVKYHAMIEAIPTWNAGGQSVELYEDHRFTEFDADAITAEIDRKMQEVRDRRSAVKPETPRTVDVVLNPHEIASFLRRLTSQLDYSVVYSGSNLYKIGDDLQKDSTGDKLNITMTGALKGSVHSAAFDADGMTLTDTQVVTDGVVSHFYGSTRYAQYLGETPTGALGCMKLRKGTMTADDLAKHTYVECASLSGLQVDLRNDYIGGEIRLAYLHEGDQVTPITGISMSASVSQVLKSVQLSDSVSVSGAYEGPEKMLLRNVAIL